MKGPASILRTLATLAAVPLSLTVGALHAQSAEIHKGVHLKVSLSQEISTKTTKKGEEFEALLAEDLSQEDRVVLPKGSLLRGVVVRATRAGRLRGRAELALHFNRIQLPSGETFDISASPVAAEGAAVDSSDEGIGGTRSSGRRSTAIVAGAAAAGTAVGAAVDGKKGAVIGAGIGIIAGIIGSAASGDKDQTLEKGTILELVLDRPAAVPSRNARH